jgi:hypothetical protein
MKKHQPVVPLLLALVLMASCSPSMKVHSDYDKTANFTQYKTFSMYKTESMTDAISQLNAQRINDAIRAEMIKKGFQETDANPDLFVNAVAILKDRTSVTASTDFYGYGGAYRPYYWGAGSGYSSTTNYNVDHYKDGSLIIDIVEASSKKLLWQGIGNREIDGPVKDADKRIPKGVNTIMATFPPGAGKKT